VYLAHAGEGSVRDLSFRALDQAIACCGTTLEAARGSDVGWGMFSLEGRLDRVGIGHFWEQDSHKDAWKGRPELEANVWGRPTTMSARPIGDGFGSILPQGDQARLRRLPPRRSACFSGAYQERRRASLFR